MIWSKQTKDTFIVLYHLTFPYTKISVFQNVKETIQTLKLQP